MVFWMTLCDQELMNKSYPFCNRLGKCNTSDIGLQHRETMQWDKQATQQVQLMSGEKGSHDTMCVRKTTDKQCTGNAGETWKHRQRWWSMKAQATEAIFMLIHPAIRNPISSQRWLAIIRPLARRSNSNQFQTAGGKSGSLLSRSTSNSGNLVHGHLLSVTAEANGEPSPRKVHDGSSQEASHTRCSTYWLSNQSAHKYQLLASFSPYRCA